MSENKDDGATTETARPIPHAWWIRDTRGCVKRQMGVIDVGLVTIEARIREDGSPDREELELFTRQVASLPVLIDGLDTIDKMLRIPAAEYVPAISDVFSVIDALKATIANPQRK